ncbi:Transcriptional regulator, GntR [Geobacillus thermoleovorans CCB_US3_UF5]|uniref:Transcriptional regulator, GntR n=1 Tax=Geobacillus thermoleovorans CCB_US3_UF5 TaxID=1111068 RepID=A0ABM5MHK4_GEOTH|nr:Transcriptional regulator, GntR [Geobacillus thermoleovorans CCB_US3_UF5]
MFELDIRSRQPIYEQLIDKMKEMIVLTDGSRTISCHRSGRWRNS